MANANSNRCEDTSTHGVKALWSHIYNVLAERARLELFKTLPGMIVTGILTYLVATSGDSIKNLFDPGGPDVGVVRILGTLGSEATTSVCTKTNSPACKRSDFLVFYTGKESFANRPQPIKLRCDADVEIHDYYAYGAATKEEDIESKRENRDFAKVQRKDPEYVNGKTIVTYNFVRNSAYTVIYGAGLTDKCEVLESHSEFFTRSRKENFSFNALIIVSLTFSIVISTAVGIVASQGQGAERAFAESASGAPE